MGRQMALVGYEVLTGKSPIDILDKPGLVAEVKTIKQATANRKTPWTQPELEAQHH